MAKHERQSKARGQVDWNECDVFSKKDRSRIMRSIGGKNTKSTENCHNIVV